MFISRRVLLGLCATASTLGFGSRAIAQSDIGLLVQLGELLGKTAEAITKLGDSVAHLVKTGVTGLDAVQARRAHNDLVDLRKRVTQVTSMQNVVVLNTLEGYLNYQRRAKQLNMKPPRDPEKYWPAVIGSVEATLQKVSEILGRIDLVRGDFIWQEAYVELRNAVSGRAMLLQRIRTMEPPISDEDLKALEDVVKAYRAMMAATEKANSDLAAYVRALN